MAVVNENKVRLVALWVFILLVVSVWAVRLPIAIFLVVDFFLRGFGLGKYSPLGVLSDLVVALLHIANKPIYFPPKRFAARIGFILSLMLTGATLLQLETPALAVISVFGFFAFLESFLGFCAGCRIYALLLQLKLIKP